MDAEGPGRLLALGLTLVMRTDGEIVDGGGLARGPGRSRAASISRLRHLDVEPACHDLGLDLLGGHLRVGQEAGSPSGSLSSARCTSPRSRDEVLARL